MGISQFNQYLFIVIGIYCIIRGIITITTGKISAREEAQLKEYSAKGVKRYKIFLSVSNIIGGLFCIAVSVLKIINFLDQTIYLIVAIAIIVIMLVLDVVIKKSCKEAK